MMCGYDAELKTLLPETIRKPRMFARTPILLYRHKKPTCDLPVTYRLSTEVGIGIRPLTIRILLPL